MCPGFLKKVGDYKTDIVMEEYFFKRENDEINFSCCLGMF